MKTMMPKYSLLLPVHNSIKYISTCINSILSQNFYDFELVISDNYSNDGTSEYLNSLTDKRIKLFHTKSFISQPENWNFVISKASGTWVILIGADDAITPYFFNTSEYLTKIADRNGINLIKSNRIYYFWDDARFIYGDDLFYYHLSPKTSIKKTSHIFKKALYNCEKFYDIPQMYTTSLFKKNIIDDFLNNNNLKKIIDYNSPDAYLGTFACISQKKYIYSELPLGWVGSSSNSQGIKDKTSKDKYFLSKDEAINFDSNSYKTINCTNFLLVGSYLKLQKLFFINPNKYFINIKKLFYAAKKDILKSKSKERYSYFCNYVKYFNIKNFNFKYKEKCIHNNLLKKLTTKIMNKLNSMVINCFPSKDIDFHYTYNDSTYSLSDINNLIKDNTNIKKLL